MASTTYYVYVVIRTNDIGAIDNIYTALYNLDNDLYFAGSISTTDLLEGIGEAEGKALTEEERHEFWERYGGLKSEGYEHLVHYEGVVTAEGKDTILKILNVDEKLFDEYDYHGKTYNGIHGIVKLTITISPQD